MNLETVQQLRAGGVTAVYGDASHQDTLVAAGADRAADLFLSASGMKNAAEVIREARELNPDIRVLVRCTYLRDVTSLLEAGADQVFSGEGEVALAMTESLLRRLGATPNRSIANATGFGLTCSASFHGWRSSTTLVVPARVYPPHRPPGMPEGRTGGPDRARGRNAIWQSTARVRQVCGSVPAGVREWHDAHDSYPHHVAFPDCPRGAIFLARGLLHF